MDILTLNFKEYDPRSDVPVEFFSVSIQRTAKKFKRPSMGFSLMERKDKLSFMWKVYRRRRSPVGSKLGILYRSSVTAW